MVSAESTVFCVSGSRPSMAELGFLNRAPMLDLGEEQPCQQLEEVHWLTTGWGPLSVREMVLLTSTSKICWPASCIPAFAMICGDGQHVCLIYFGLVVI